MYDDTIYNNILSAKEEETTHNTSNYNVQQNDPYTFSNSDKETFVLPQTNLLETFNNNEGYNTGYNAGYNLTNATNKKQDKNNLRFYNLPLGSQELNKSQGLNNSRAIQLPNKKLISIENFENSGEVCDEECDGYITHIINCDKCKSILMKQLNIESDNKRNEELMELISYLIFAIFILLLVNSLKTPH